MDWFFGLVHCLMQPNQDIHFLLHVIFIIKIRPWIIQTVNLYFYAPEILLLKVFINACKLTGEMPIDWSFFLGVWHSVNSLSVSLTDWNLSSSSIHLGDWSRHLENDHLFTFNFTMMFHQYCTRFTFSPLQNITKHLFLM